MKHFDKISERLETTIANIEHQQGCLFWDDLEKLEEVLQRVKELEEANETNLQSLQRIAEIDIPNEIVKPIKINKNEND